VPNKITDEDVQTLLDQVTERYADRPDALAVITRHAGLFLRGGEWGTWFSKNYLVWCLTQPRYAGQEDTPYKVCRCDNGWVWEELPSPTCPQGRAHVCYRCAGIEPPTFREDNEANTAETEDATTTP
jgi:hypothetical protein